MTLAAVRIVRDAVSALRLELAEMRLSGGRAPGCAMTAAAVTLAVMITLALRLEDAWWAGISAFVSTRATAPASIERGVLRILGTIGGVAVSLLLSPWLAGDAVTLTLVLFAVSTLGVLGFLVSPHGYAWLLSAITADMVLLALLGDPLSAVSVAANRTAEVTIGTVAAILVVLVLAPEADAAPAAPAPGWSDLLGAQWAAVQHALRAGVGVLLVPLVWNWLELPGLSQTAITVAAVMAVPALSQDAEKNRETVNQRALHRLLGCLCGGLAGLACLALSVDSLPIWLAMLTTGIWVAAHVQGSTRGIGYIGTQAAVVFILTLVQGSGPPQSILPGIDRFAGVTGGLLILLAVSALSAPSPGRGAPVAGKIVSD
jgi:uncharacterized membrane protein YccC